MNERRQTMKTLSAVALLLMIAGCGVETASTAATGAVIKKQEMEEGKKTLESAQAKVGQAVEQMQQRSESDASK